MKIQHIKYALAVADAGSINRAAEGLFLSQPNLSSALKTLETELGFSIFERNNSGVSVTAEGQEFLVYARNILQEYEQITTIKSRQKLHRLSISAGYHSIIEEAFALLCTEYSEGNLVNFSLHNNTTAVTIDRVYQNESDLGIILLPKSESDVAERSRLYEKKGMDLQVIYTLPFYVYLRAQHPLLKNGTLDVAGVWDYPFVDYSNQVLSSAANQEYLHMVNPDLRISVDNRDTRFRIVSISNAYSYGCGQHPRIQEQYPLVNVSLPNVMFDLVAIRRKDHPLSAPGRRYLQILRQEATLLD